MSCLSIQDIYPTEPNNRYKNYGSLSIFVAGDEEQFNNHRSAINGTKDEDIDLNHIAGITYTDKMLWSGYALSDQSIDYTFNYIFNKFKKGIYVKIVDNVMVNFLPFSKHRFINEWSGLMKVDPSRFRSFQDLFQHISTLQGYNFNSGRVGKYPNQWYANNCLIRYEYPLAESDTNMVKFIHMFQTLCRERKVPNVEFFLNRRDFPILTKDGTEPYNNIYGSGVPLLSWNQGPYAPILSMCVNNRYADVPIPTHEDWARVASIDGTTFKPKCQSYKYNFDLPWDERIPKAVFRGGSTGCGTTTSTLVLSNFNQRMKLAELGQQYGSLMDAGITNWNVRPRKVEGEPYIQVIEPHLPTVPKLDPEGQARYKYLINVDGHVSAFRLSLELSMGCCILMVESMDGWKMWFSHLLRPYVHYVPIKSDLSDLVEKIGWCKDHDDECRVMATNALNFYNTYLTKEPLLDYLQTLCVTIHKKLGNVCYGSKYTTYQDQLRQISTLPKVIHNTVFYELPLMNLYRGYNNRMSNGWNEALQTLFRNSDFMDLLRLEEAIVTNNRTTIHKASILNYPHLIVKKAVDTNASINEAFMSTFLLNKLYGSIPNFVYCYGYNKDSLLFEHINGLNMLQAIQQRTIKLKNVLELLLQCVLATMVAGNHCFFIHNDLNVWNVMVNELETPLSIDYNLTTNEKNVDRYRLLTKHVAVMVDYGRSIGVYNGYLYGQIEKFRLVPGQDIFTLSISICIQLFKLRLADSYAEIVDACIHIIKFFNPSVVDEYMAKQFAFKYKKYADVVQANEAIFEPLNYLNHLKPLLKKHKVAFGKTTTKQAQFMDYSTITNKNHPKQVMEYVVTKNKVQSILNTTKALYQTTLPQPDTMVGKYLVAQSLMDMLSKLKADSNLLVERSGVMVKNVDRSVKFISNLYNGLLRVTPPEKWSISLPDFNLIEKLNIKFNSLIKTIDIGMDRTIYYDDIEYHRQTIIGLLQNNGPFKVHDVDYFYKLLPRPLTWNERKLLYSLNTYNKYCG